VITGVGYSPDGKMITSHLPQDNQTNVIQQSHLSTDPLWTVEEVAHYLRVKPGTVRAMARRGELPAIKVGRIWRFKADKIETLLENHEIA
jgi:excisionase family DNA binding protein